jgi:hypothetical protein
MVLGNEASTEPRIAKLEVSEQPGVRRIMADPGGLRPLSRPLQILLNGPLWRRHYHTGGSLNLCAVALVKQDRENDLFHIFDLGDRSDR